MEKSMLTQWWDEALLLLLSFPCIPLKVKRMRSFCKIANFKKGEQMRGENHEA
jgi:hypothetical protein